MNIAPSPLDFPCVLFRAPRACLQVATASFLQACAVPAFFSLPPWGSLSHFPRTWHEDPLPPKISPRSVALVADWFPLNPPPTPPFRPRPCTSMSQGRRSASSSDLLLPIRPPSPPSRIRRHSRQPAFPGVNLFPSHSVPWYS